MERPTVRGIVLKESLVHGDLPMPMSATVVRRYPYLLDGRMPVEVIELAVTRKWVLAVAMQIAEALLPGRFYAHLLDSARMYVCFPNCLVLVQRGENDSVQRAQEIGTRFGIPIRQMRFAEMFDRDHPDAAASVNGRAEGAWTAFPSCSP
ncbi:MAG: hypothetical protein ACT4NY_17365 [Pseudonocardiales bacterium]